MNKAFISALTVLTLLSCKESSNEAYAEVTTTTLEQQVMIDENENLIPIFDDLQEVYVIIDSLNVREEPNPDLSGFATLSEGETVFLTGEVSENTATYTLRGTEYTTNFLKVLLANGSEGWVFATAVSKYSMYSLPWSAEGVDDSIHTYPEDETIVGEIETQWGSISTNIYGEYLISDYDLYEEIFKEAIYTGDRELLKRLCIGDVKVFRSAEKNTDIVIGELPEENDIAKAVVSHLNFEVIIEHINLAAETPIRFYVNDKSGLYLNINNETDSYYNLDSVFIEIVDP